MSDKKKINMTGEIVEDIGDEDGATPSVNKSRKKKKVPKKQQLPPPKVTQVSDHERDSKKKKKKKAKKDIPDIEEGATQTSSKKKRTSKTELPSETTPAVGHESETSSKKKKKKSNENDGTKKKKKQKKASEDEDSNTTPTKSTKNKSMSKLQRNDDDSPNKKKRMVQFETDGTVREHSLKYIFSSISQKDLLAKNVKRKGKKPIKESRESRDASVNTLPTISNHSSSHMSFSTNMESFKNPYDSYGKLSSDMRGQYDHEDFMESPYDRYMTEKGYIEKHPVVDVCDHDDEYRIRYKKTTMDLADTSIINNRRCIIIAGIFFLICTLTISVLCSSKLAEWMGDRRRLMSTHPRQHLRVGIVSAPTTTSEDSNLSLFSF